MAPPQWAYQVENFVTKPDEELVCSVCHAIFCDPVICPCDHVFCRVCISKWLQNNRNCPICRKRVPRYTIKQMVPIIKNLIMKLTLYCRNKESGCDAQFSLESCESHMKECSFELVQCKNKPCKESLFRKDIVEHEKNGCPHRYVKCRSCDSKMSSLSSPKDHDCIKSLLLRLKRKKSVIKKKNEKIEELQNEIKNLKDATHNAEQSSLSGIPHDDIMLNIADMETVSSTSSDSGDSSDSIFAIFGQNYSDNDSDDNPSFQEYIDVIETDSHNENHPDTNEYRNAESQTVDDDQDESQNDSYNRNDSLLENNSVVLEAPDSAASQGEEGLRRRRPVKRRHPPPLLSTSDDENDFEAYMSMSSPKRCSLIGNNFFSHAGSKGGDSSNGGMEAGPSQSSSSTAEHARSNDGATTYNTKWRFRSRAKLDEKHSKNKISTPCSKSPSASQGVAVFERTLSLLEQYNLDSDPEWLPEYSSHRGNDTTTDSDSSFNNDAISNTSSSSSDSENFSENDSNEAAPNILNELYSTSEDDTDWRPGLED